MFCDCKMSGRLNFVNRFFFDIVLRNTSPNADKRRQSR